MAYTLEREEVLSRLEARAIGAALDLGHRMLRFEDHPAIADLRVARCDVCWRTIGVRVDFDRPCRGEISGGAVRERCRDTTSPPDLLGPPEESADEGHGADPQPVGAVL